VIDAISIHVDLRTLFLILAGMGALVAVAFATLNRQGAGGLAGRSWALGHGVAAAGYLLFALRGGVPDLLSVVLGNTLVLGGAVLILRALHAYAERPFPERGALAVFLAAAAGFAVLTYIRPDLSARVVLVSVAGAAFLLAGAGVLLAPRSGLRTWGHYFTAVAFAVAAAGLLVRAGLTLSRPPLHGLTGAPMFHGLSKTVLAMAVFGWSLGFMWLLNLASRRQLEREISARRHSEQRFRAIFDASASAIAFCSLSARIQMVNAAFADLLGRPAADLVGRHFNQLSHADDRGREAALLREMQTGRRQHYRMEKRYVHAAGHPVWVDLSVSVIRDAAGYPLHLVAVANEIGERKRTEEELERRANFDRLTGAVNRLPFEQLLEREQDRVDRYGSPASLIMLDIDHFKEINDRFGHPVGDRVLETMADILRGRLRETDTMARWGGEEFLLLLPETGAEDAWRVAEALRRAVAEHPFPDVGQVTISLGVAGLVREESGHDLLRRADAALYRAKAAGRNRARHASAFPDPPGSDS